MTRNEHDANLALASQADSRKPTAYTPPIPHDRTKLNELRKVVLLREKTAAVAISALVAIWDDADKHGRVEDDARARRRVAAANNALDAAKAAWLAEWKRIGSPLSDLRHA